MYVMIFDIETVPNSKLVKKLYNIDPEVDDVEMKRQLDALRMQKNGTTFLPLHLHKIVAISVLLQYGSSIKVWSLGGEEALEEEIIEKFFYGIEKYVPMLVSWNGSGFDLPVLNYRALFYKIVAKQYWETGELNPSFKWNNYINRYHARHLDLMDVLANYHNSAFAPLDEIAKMLGAPGKIDMSGKDVFDYFIKNDISTIRNYCEIDVLNTYIVYLHLQCMRGILSVDAFNKSCYELKEYLLGTKIEHLCNFANLWEF